jgi:hypothetical protein
MNSDSQRRLAAIAARWNNVEPRTKEVELLRGETIYAAVNELRYTGRKIADVLLLVAEGKEDPETLAKINEQLVVAENYLINADHDLTDSAVLFVGIRIKRIIEAHGLKKVIGVAPEYKELSQILEEAKSVVIKSRGDRANRTEVYAKLAEHHVPKLVTLYGELTAHSELSIPDQEIKKGLRLVLRHSDYDSLDVTG